MRESHKGDFRTPGAFAGIIFNVPFLSASISDFIYLSPEM
jgi:hypothetical protein